MRTYRASLIAATTVALLTVTAFGAGGKSSDWKGQLADVAADAAGSVTLESEKGVLFYAFDTLAHPTKAVDLTVRLQKAKGFTGIEGCTVTFFKAGKEVGKARSDEDGYARIQWTPPAEGQTTFTAKVTDAGEEDEEITQISAATLVVAAYPKNKPMIIIDLDHTVVASSFARVLIGGAKPMADSQAVIKRLAEKHGIVYLTHRPDIMTRTSKAWLRENNYSIGPLLVSKLKEAIGDSGEYKTGRIKALRKSFSEAKIGIGDKLSDALAYVDNGMTAYLLPHYKDKPENLREMAAELKKLPNKERLQVVGSWKEVEAGIFDGKRFTAEAFAARLEARAKQLDRIKAEKKKDDDDDDDDDD